MLASEKLWGHVECAATETCESCRAKVFDKHPVLKVSECSHRAYDVCQLVSIEEHAESHPRLQVLLTKHDQLSPGVSKVVSTFLGGHHYYRPSYLFPQSVCAAVQQGFRFPVWQSTGPTTVPAPLAYAQLALRPCSEAWSPVPAHECDCIRQLASGNRCTLSQHDRALVCSLGPQAWTMPCKGCATSMLWLHLPRSTT